MLFENLPIGRRLIAITLLTSGVVLLLSCAAFMTYDFLSFRQTARSNITTLGKVIATNSTAALAFDNAEDAADVLAALRAEAHLVAAGLYDARGALFAKYPRDVPANALPAMPERDGLRFGRLYISGVEPVRLLSGKRLGTLYLKFDQQGLYSRLTLYSAITVGSTAMGLLIAFLLSRSLQQQISQPILALVRTAKAVSEDHDYSVRVPLQVGAELGRLTGAFNQMLERIEDQDRGLRESESRVRAVIDSALSAVIVMASDGRIVDWNLRAAEVFGWTREAVLGKELADLVIPERYREDHRRGLLRYMASGEGPALNRPLELAAIRRSGKEFPIELSVSPLLTGTTTTFCGFVTDITERAQSQGRIHAQLMRLDLLHRITHAIGERQDLSSIFQVVIRSLEDHLPIDFGCICLYDTEEQALTMMSVGAGSRQLAAQLDMSEGTRLCFDHSALLACAKGLVYEPDIAATPSDFVNRLLEGGLRALVVAPLLAEGKLLGVLIAARRQPDAFGSADCEFLRQLADHVALAAHQAQLHGALQRAYDDLQQTQRAVMQQERLHALGQMASGVAHDINNAISPVSLYTEALLEREPGLSDRGRGYLVTIQRAIEDVAETVSRMREFYRPQEAQANSVRIEINRIVPQVVELTRVRWSDLPQQRGVVIVLRTELDRHLPPILGAQNEIRDALTNLIFNAVDAMPDGGVLTVRTRVESPSVEGALESASVYLEVIDSGVGMDEETARHCLEPFFTTKGERGTGLGLAMVYGMTERHGAKLEIKSEPGVGTSVALVFPAVARVSEATSRHSMLSVPTRSLRILTVDDDPVVIESLGETLRAVGHVVTTADGGQAGIDAFLEAQRRGERFDAVITDLGMPHVDGRQVAAAIKKASHETPIILLTGWGQRLRVDGDIPDYVDRVLNKPPKLRELRAALAQLAGEASSALPL